MNGGPDLCLVHTSKYSVVSFLWQRYLLVDKNSKCYAESSFAYVPEMTMDSGDKTEEATANLWVCVKFSVTGRTRRQTFACDNFSLPYKNWHASFSANVFVTKFGQIFSCIRANKNSHWKTCHRKCARVDQALGLRGSLSKQLVGGILSIKISSWNSIIIQRSVL